MVSPLGDPNAIAACCEAVWCANLAEYQPRSFLPADTAPVQDSHTCRAPAMAHRSPGHVGDYTPCPDQAGYGKLIKQCCQ